MTKLADELESLGEALHGLSAILLLNKTLEDDKAHAAYEKVVQRFAALRPEPAPDVVEAAKALLAQFDAYLESDLNHECAHRFLVRYELWDNLRAALSQSHDVANHSSDARNMVDVAGLVEALKWYAKEYNWRSSSVYMCGHSGASAGEVDRGNKARAALRKFGGQP